MEAQIESEPVVPVPVASRETGWKGQAFELKGTMASLTALRLNTADTGAVAKQLVAKVAQMPQFFRDAAVVVDLGGLGQDAAKVRFSELAALLRSCKMVPVAVANAEGEVRARAASAGFGCMPAAARTRVRSAEPATPPADVTGEAAREEARSAEATAAVRKAPPERRQAAPAPVRVLHRPPLVIHQPVRSGQRVYAEAADLLILAPVNSGAEVVADGHVHVYSTLRGRAVAGAQGRTDARIFCQRLDAELAVIAGAYILADDLPAEHKGKAVQIYLEDGVCKVSPL